MDNPAVRNNRTIECLPHEILLDVFSYLDGNDLLNCRSVCAAWRTIATDGFLWQRKLCELCGRRWSVIVCERKPQNPPDMSDLNAIHPYVIYRFLSRYVPKYLLYQPLDLTASDALSPELDNELVQHQQTFQRSFGQLLKRCWSNMVNRFSLINQRRNERAVVPPHRFAVFGPGFDQRATSRLFNKLVNAKTRSFEPVSLIPGRMGFGAGLTLRLYAQAQAAVSDQSVQKLPKSTSQLLGSTSTGLSVVAKPLDNMTDRAATTGTFASTSSLNPQQDANGTTPSNTTEHHEDFIFDLHYLYSLRGNLTSTFSNQLERILRSRFFKHDVTDMTDLEILSKLTVTESMRNILNGINGIIYALDARDSVEESRYLLSELTGILRSLPKRLANVIPIVILYIMPKEEIMLKPTVRRNSSNRSVNVTMLNRDSYSGVEYTVSWLGSLLLPVSCLRLFELDNPWRLQKCASNDIKAVIQCIMWLRQRAPPIPNEQLHRLTIANSIW